jgi:hypothetical protein
VDNILKANEGVSKAVKDSEQAKECMKLINNFGLQSLVILIAPHLMKEIKATDPETYYGLKIALQNFEKMTKDMLLKLSKELETL